MQSVGYVARKKTISDRRPGRAFFLILVLLKKRPFWCQLFRSSFVKLSFLHPSRHTFTPHKSSPNTSPTLGLTALLLLLLLLYCCCCCCSQRSPSQNPRGVHEAVFKILSPAMFQRGQTRHVCYQNDGTQAVQTHPVDFFNESETDLFRSFQSDGTRISLTASSSFLFPHTCIQCLNDNR